MTNAEYYLQKVKEFRDACGIKQVDDDLHLELLDEESNELALAAAKNDRGQIADGFADCLFIYCGWELDGKPPIPYSEWISGWVKKAQSFQIDLLSAFEIVHASNMTKLCNTESFDSTNDKYSDLGVIIDWRNVGDDLFSAHAANTTDKIPAGKLLKPTSFKEPDWDATREQWDMTLWNRKLDSSAKS